VLTVLNGAKDALVELGARLASVVRATLRRQDNPAPRFASGDLLPMAKP